MYSKSEQYVYPTKYIDLLVLHSKHCLRSLDAKQLLIHQHFCDGSRQKQLLQNVGLIGNDYICTSAIKQASVIYMYTNEIE